MVPTVTDAGGEAPEGWAVSEIFDEVVRKGEVSHV